MTLSIGRTRVKVGDVVQVVLPDGTHAYGRVLREASVAFYRARTVEPRTPPIGSRDYQFTVGVYTDVVGSRRLPIVGHDPSNTPEDEWPPPGSVRDPISGRFQLYHHGEMRPATEDECRGLERVAAWDYHDIVARLMGSRPFGTGDLKGD